MDSAEEETNRMRLREQSQTEPAGWIADNQSPTTLHGKCFPTPVCAGSGSQPEDANLGHGNFCVDDDLFLLIQQLEFERAYLRGFYQVTHTSQQNPPLVTNGWHSGNISPEKHGATVYKSDTLAEFCPSLHAPGCAQGSSISVHGTAVTVEWPHCENHLPPTAIYNGLSSTDPSSTVFIPACYPLTDGCVVLSPSSRIKQIDMELGKLRLLQEFEERDAREKKKSKSFTNSSHTSSTSTSTVTDQTIVVENGLRRQRLGVMEEKHELDLLPSGNCYRRTDPQVGWRVNVAVDMFRGVDQWCYQYSASVLGASRREMFLMLLAALDSEVPSTVDRMLTLCTSREHCISFVQWGAIPLVVQLIHDQKCGISTSSPEVRATGGRILHHLVHCQSDDKRGRREAAVLRLLEEVRSYSSRLLHHHASIRGAEEDDNSECSEALNKLVHFSSENEYRHAICFLGGLQATAEVLQCNYNSFGNTATRSHITIRKQTCLLLINLSYGDGLNKALLCSSMGFLETLVHLLSSTNEDLRIAVADVLRNVSWRADINSKENLKNSKAVGALLKTAFHAKNNDMLRASLSALNNLSAHYQETKHEICATEGALAFLVEVLRNRMTLKDPRIVETAGGILQNLIGIIGLRDDYRQILRESKLLVILVDHLRLSNLAIVFNACSIISTLSARSEEDQERLWELNAVGLLQRLMDSRQRSIAVTSSKAVKNLMVARPKHFTGGESSHNQRSRENAVGEEGTEGLSAGGGLFPMLRDEEGSSNEEEHERPNNRPRRNVSVPNSPSKNSRRDMSTGSNRSMRSIDSMRSRRSSDNSDRRERTIQMMADVTRHVNEGILPDVVDTESQLKIERQAAGRNLIKNPMSPPISPDREGPPNPPKRSHISPGSKGPMVRPYHPSVLSSFTVPAGYVQSRQTEDPPHPPHNSWFDHEQDSPTEEEEETRDEFRDYGRHDVQRYNGPLEYGTKRAYFVPSAEKEYSDGNPDTVRKFETETTPNFSTAVSVVDLRSLTGGRKDDSAIRTASRAASSISKPMDPSKKRALINDNTSIPRIKSTSMMCSRSSSPGVLSELDVNFSHVEDNNSEIQSEYSRTISEAVSPSEIPSSPSLMRKPATPRQMNKTRRILPALPLQARDEEEKKTEEKEVRAGNKEDAELLQQCIDAVIRPKEDSVEDGDGKVEVSAADGQPVVAFVLPPLVALEPVVHEVVLMQDSPRKFDEESRDGGGTPGLSTATSLSDLTVSDISGIQPKQKIPSSHNLPSSEFPIVPTPGAGSHFVQNNPFDVGTGFLELMRSVGKAKCAQTPESIVLPVLCSPPKMESSVGQTTVEDVASPVPQTADQELEGQFATGLDVNRRNVDDLDQVVVSPLVSSLDQSPLDQCQAVLRDDDLWTLDYQESEMKDDVQAAGGVALPEKAAEACTGEDMTTQDLASSCISESIKYAKSITPPTTVVQPSPPKSMETSLTETSSFRLTSLDTRTPEPLPPPLPPPFEEELEGNLLRVDLLTDCIYAELPASSIRPFNKKSHGSSSSRHAKKGKVVQKERSVAPETVGNHVKNSGKTSARRQYLQKSIDIITGVPHSNSATNANVSESEETGEMLKSTTKSRSFPDSYGELRPSPAFDGSREGSISAKRLPREHLKLNLSGKAAPLAFVRTEKKEEKINGDDVGDGHEPTAVTVDRDWGSRNYDGIPKRRTDHKAGPDASSKITDEFRSLSLANRLYTGNEHDSGQSSSTDKTATTVMRNPTGYVKPSHPIGILEATSTAPYYWDSYDESDVSFSEELPNTATTQQSSSPDIFEMADKNGLAECELASRFTSEASEAEEQHGENGGGGGAGRRPRIVKPVRANLGVRKSGDGASKEGDNNKVVKPIKAGRKPGKSKTVAAAAGNGGLGLRPPSIRGGGLVIVHNEETVLPEEAAPSRIMKQGTFTVDRPHQSNMVPIIFPDSDVSRNPNTRRRFGSMTRVPRESGSSLSSADSQRQKTLSPNSRTSRHSPKPSSYPGNDISQQPPPPIHPISIQGIHPNKILKPPAPSPPPILPIPPPLKPLKKAPVTSKIAALWRGEKKSDGGSKNGSKTEGSTPLETMMGSWKKKSEVVAVPSGLKSPTLSEKFGGKKGGVLGGLSGRLTATLPKRAPSSNAAAQSFAYTFKPGFAVSSGGNEAGESSNGEGAKDGPPGGPITVTSV